VKTVVVDSFAMLAFMNKESSASTVLQRIEKAEHGTLILLMSAINAGEVYYILARRKSQADARIWAEQIMPSLPIEIVVPNLEDIMNAAFLKSQYPISYADAFAASLALQRTGPLLTGDPEFRAMPGLALDWIGS
jgi:uncharacterized protein